MNKLRRSDLGKKRAPYKKFKLKKQWLLKIWKYPHSISKTFFNNKNEVIFTKTFRTLDELAKALYMTPSSVLYISKKMRFNYTIEVKQIPINKQKNPSLESSSESDGSEQSNKPNIKKLVKDLKAI